ncbi:MAG: SH3 domain-containing protein [Planctomycetota bacterium]|nr:SH3 domain-containing protein [Planctomycetota bacterium]
MRTMQAALACLLAVTLAILPAAAWAAASKVPTGPEKATSKAKPESGRTARPAAKTAAPALPPPPIAPPDLPGGPAIPSLSPAAPLPPALPALEPLSPAAPGAPALPPLPPTPIAPPPAPARVPTAPAVPPEGEPPAAAKPAFPYSGYVSAEAVRIRSGPGLYYYPLATVNSGVPVIVEGDAEGWLALRPTEGIWGLVKKSDVEVAPDGKKATVLAPSARIYAASASASRSWCVMATLKQGDTVQVLGPAAAAEFVKIAPPEGSHMYVVAQYVTAGTGPSGVGAAMAQLSEPPKLDPLVEDFKKADAALEEEMRKPVGERDYKTLAGAFKEILDKAEKFYLKRAAQERLALIQNLDAEQAAYLKVLAIGDRLDKRLADIKAQETARTAEAEREKKLARPEFAASGMLQLLESLEDVDYPIKYKIVDQNNHPLVVLKSSTYDLSKYVGKVIGVRGQKTYLKDWRIYLVTVDDLEVLE